MAGGEEDLPIFDYPVISVGGPKEPKQGEKWEEDVFRALSSDGWDHAEANEGKIEIQALGPPGTPNFKAVFGSTVIDGKVPGGDRWQGKGKAKAKRPDREKDIDIEFVNPKRWG